MSSTIQTVATREGTGPDRASTSRRRGRWAGALAALGLATAATAFLWPSSDPDLGVWAYDLEVTGAPAATVTGPLGDSVTVAESTPDLRVEQWVAFRHDQDHEVTLTDLSDHLAVAEGRLQHRGCSLVPVEIQVAVTQGSEAASRPSLTPFTSPVTFGPGESIAAQAVFELRSGVAACEVTGDDVLGSTGLVAELDGGSIIQLDLPPVEVIGSDLDAWLDDAVTVRRH